MSIKSLVNKPEIYKEFTEEISTRLKKSQKQLNQAQTWDEACRFQGEIRSLEKLLKLREYINGDKKDN